MVLFRSFYGHAMDTQSSFFFKKCLAVYNWADYERGNLISTLLCVAIWENVLGHSHRSGNWTPILFIAFFPIRLRSSSSKYFNYTCDIKRMNAKFPNFLKFDSSIGFISERGRTNLNSPWRFKSFLICYVLGVLLSLKEMIKGVLLSSRKVHLQPIICGHRWTTESLLLFGPYYQL